MITVEQIAAAGVVGAGGAGFPTHVKLSGKADTVVINAAECEPLLHKDKELILHRTEMLVEGLARAMQLVGAARGIVGIKKKYVHVTETLRPKLAAKMEIVPLDDAYPSGDEFILVYESLGRVIPPGGIPLAVGAVVMNVETACNVAAVGIKTVTEKFVSVAGSVEHPCTLRVSLGTPLNECIKAAGGTIIADPAFVVGGAMMGYIETDLSKPVTKTTGGVLVLPQNHFIVQRKQWDWKKTARIGRTACDQCSFCTELCPRNLLGHPIEPHRAMRSLGFNLSARSDVPGTIFCCECNLCSYYSCPEGLDPKNVCTENKRRLLADKQRWENPPFRPERPDQQMRNRKTPTTRLIQKIGLAGYQNKGPLDDRLLEVQNVVLPLRQHIGAACVPIVQPGNTVHIGQPIAQRPVTNGKPALGADIHASISGTVTEINSENIRITASIN
ncbi:MAG: SLBB domain-containing protein [Planctomycetaceae bacterium]|jgi:Na+-translocating ferredoxin:NAD+ oxidoreductase RnfC subunit|nr:SLBB domain-containing protein [Planctomycetaceae bacterium]